MKIGTCCAIGTFLAVFYMTSIQARNIDISSIVFMLMSSQAETIDISRNGDALLQIVVGPDAGELTRKTAADLALYLTRISGATFTVVEGGGSAGIVIGIPRNINEIPFSIAFPAGPFEREEYIIRSRGNGLYLLGATPLAVRHAAWDLLYRFGYRHYFSNPIWEIVPDNPNLSIAVDYHDKPDYYARNIWYRQGEQEGDNEWGEMADHLKNWKIHNRMAKGFDLKSSHSYGGIINRNSTAFNDHPEYRALVDGTRVSSPNDGQFCPSNLGLRQLNINDAVAQIQANPSLDSISRDPNDGFGWCDCDGDNPDGTHSNCHLAFHSISDQALTLANEAAVAINNPAFELGPKYVGMYAYNQHQYPPGIDVYSNVIVSCANGFLGGQMTFDEIITGWQAKGATIGIYEYYAFAQWDMSRPRDSDGAYYQELAANIARWHGLGARFLSGESSDAWGANGLGYYTSNRIMWDINELVDIETINDNFSRWHLARQKSRWHNSIT